MNPWNQKKPVNRLKPIDTFIDDLSALPRLQSDPKSEIDAMPESVN
jgi:hypothetical protein